MALNTSMTNGPRSFRDLGSERAQTKKLIAKALKKLGKTPEEVALEKLQSTIAKLPQPSARMWTYDTSMVTFGPIVVDVPASMKWTLVPESSTREERGFRCKFRDHGARKANGWELPKYSQFMRQVALPFPPTEETSLFRVEHEFSISHSCPKGIFRRGPYASGGALDAVPYSEICPESGTDLTPGPYDDGELIPQLRKHGRELSGSCFFGFRSLDAMKSWFRSSDFWASVPRARYTVREYRGIAFHGRRQSVLDASYPVTCVREVPLSEVLG